MNEIQALEKASEVVFQKYCHMQPDNPEKMELIYVENEINKMLREKAKDEILEYTESNFDMTKVEEVDFRSNTVSPYSWIWIKYKDYRCVESPSFNYEGDASTSTVFDVLREKYENTGILFTSTLTD